KEWVVGSCDTKTQHKQGGADRENITVICTICADGSTIPPHIIYRGKNLQKSWFEGNVANAVISKSEKGWTDRVIGLAWLRDVFDKNTREKANGRTCVLILDGHSSHYSLDFVRYARENNIIVLAYPPHCTHALQGLYVVCFAHMKACWQEEIQTYEEAHRKPPAKADFTSLFGSAYLRAFTPETVKAAFEKTGIYPFNPNAVTATQTKPSLPSSLKGTFPLPMPSPVRAVMAAFSAHPPTAFALDPATHEPIQSSPVAGQYNY
ncbi:DDE-domain-containing protein, partial [Fistulina hepatica ATCC 64428]